jgi:hypothetical protein
MLEVTGRKPDWKPYQRGFATMLGVGRATEQRYETELKKAGYMTVEKLHDTKGHFSGYRKTFLCCKSIEMIERMKNVPDI